MLMRLSHFINSISERNCVGRCLSLIIRKVYVDNLDYFVLSYSKIGNCKSCIIGIDCFVLIIRIRINESRTKILSNCINSISIFINLYDLVCAPRVQIADCQFISCYLCFRLSQNIDINIYICALPTMIITAGCLTYRKLSACIAFLSTACSIIITVIIVDIIRSISAEILTNT